MTAFLDEHPGGSEIMVDVTGRDATDDFEDVVHSSTARKQLEGMYIGDLHVSLSFSFFFFRFASFLFSYSKL